jgi:hypothetical protein
MCKNERNNNNVNIIIIIIITIFFMQGIYTYIPEINNVAKEYNVAAILSLLFMVPVLALMYFYISTFRSIIIIIIRHFSRAMESANVELHNMQYFTSEITLHVAHIVNPEQLQHCIPFAGI